MSRRNYRRVTVLPPSLLPAFRSLKRSGHLPGYCVPCVVPRRFTFGPWCAKPLRDYDGSPL